MITFEEAAMQFSNERDFAREAGVRIANGRAAIQKLKQDLATTEADLLINGEVTGNNAEARKASLAVILDQDPAYQHFRQQMITAQLNLDSAEVDRDHAIHGMSLARRLMDWALVDQQYKAFSMAAGVFGSLPEQEKEGTK
jgi:hypothetical protein